MFLSGFHASAGNGPDLGLVVYLRPLGADDLAGSAGAENGKFQHEGRYRVPLPQIGHECRHVVERHGRMMAALELLLARQQSLKVATPARGVLTASQALCLGGVQHALDPAAQPGGGFLFLLPERLKHLQHLLGADSINRDRSQLGGINRERVRPLPAMLLVAEAFLDIRYNPVGEIAEGRFRRCGGRPSAEPR